MLKTVPTRGFRQETSFCVVGATFANKAMRISPKKENVRKNIVAKLRCVLKTVPLTLSKDLGLQGKQLVQGLQEGEEDIHP